MKAPLKLFPLVFLALLLPAAEGLGLFGLGDQSKHKTALLWVPPESFADWTVLSEFFKNNEAFKLTVGVSPEMLTPEAKSQLDPWIAQGRLELALRVPGDPILPLISRHPGAPRPDDPLNRIAAAREDYRAKTGTFPAGFVPGGGALEPELLESFGALGLRWVAAGDYNKGADAPWGIKNAATFIALSSDELQDGGGEGSAAPDAFVIDEAGGSAPPGSLAKLLARLPSRSWLTLSQALETRSVVDAATISPWPTWSGDYSLWTRSPAQKKAWKMYADACLALDRYQNSGTADLKVLENATGQLYLAQSSKYYLAPENPGGPWHAHLAAVYRQINHALPLELRASGAGPKHGPSWLEFEAYGAPAGAPAENDIWKFLSLRVEWSAEDVTFIYKMSRLEADESSLHGFGRLRLDTYIDLNRRAGSGSTKLLAGVKAHLISRDAWEYALTVAGSGARLYRFKAQAEPLLTAEVNPVIDLKNAEIKVKIPRQLLRGNPLRWGYFAAAMEPEAKEIIGILGPAQPTGPKAGALKRFTASRAVTP